MFLSIGSFNSLTNFTSANFHTTPWFLSIFNANITRLRGLKFALYVIYLQFSFVTKYTNGWFKLAGFRRSPTLAASLVRPRRAPDGGPTRSSRLLTLPLEATGFRRHPTIAAFLAPPRRARGGGPTRSSRLAGPSQCRWFRGCGN